MPDQQPAEGPRCSESPGQGADQEKEGFSIPAQQRLLREYAQQSNIIIAEEFVDVETARAAGRTGFSKLLAYLKQHRNRARSE